MTEDGGVEPATQTQLECYQAYKKHLTYRQVLDICGGATGDRTPDLMTASDEKSSAGITCCYLLLAVVSENGQTGGVAS